MHWWVRQYPVTQAAEEAKISEATAVQAYQYLRDICSWRLTNVDSPLLLGGPGVVIQIDESLFRHKPKVKHCRSSIYTFSGKCILSFQYHRGRPPQSDQWVFGMVDTSHTPALGIITMVPQRDAATLLPIITQHIRPGSIVWSDQWAAYRRVQTLTPAAQHQTVNHSIEFINPTTGVHTQNIESYWNRVKTKFKRMKGVHESMLSSSLSS